MSAKPKPAAAAHEMSLVEKIAQHNLRNIGIKVRDGKSLTASEARLLAEAQREEQTSASEMIRRGLAVMREIRDIIEGSALARHEKDRILDQLASIEP